jgi:hypothetical protein
MNSGKKIRVEHQEYPNQKAADASIRKLFPNGKLVEIDDFDNTA